MLKRRFENGAPFFVDDANRCDLRQYFNNGCIVYSAAYRKHDRTAKNGQIRHSVSTKDLTENERSVRMEEKRHYYCDGTKQGGQKYVDIAFKLFYLIYIIYILYYIFYYK